MQAADGIGLALRQKTREDSGLSALHDIIESGQIELIENLEKEDEASVMVRLPATAAAAAERQRESVAAMRVGEAMLRRNRGGPMWPWLVLVAIAVVLVALAMLTHFGVVTKPW